MSAECGASEYDVRPSEHHCWVCCRSWQPAHRHCALGTDIEEVTARQAQAQHRRHHDYDPSGALHAGPPEFMRYIGRSTMTAAARPTASAAAITHKAVCRLVRSQSKPKVIEQANLANATTVWAAAIPLARLSSGTDWVASADSTPSVAA